MNTSQFELRETGHFMSLNRSTDLTNKKNKYQMLFFQIPSWKYNATPSTSPTTWAPPSPSTSSTYGCACRCFRCRKSGPDAKSQRNGEQEDAKTCSKVLSIHFISLLVTSYELSFQEGKKAFQHDRDAQSRGEKEKRRNWRFH